MPPCPRTVRPRGGWWIILLFALLFVGAHLPFLASSLEDIDSVNFALGVRDFDPARHRPHPPGYPIYIGLAKLARLALDEPGALAVWGAVFGGLAAFPLVVLFGALSAAGGGLRLPDRGGRTSAARDPAIWGTVLVLLNPLFWMTAARPMSDVAGLAVSVAAQACLVLAFVRQARVRAATTRDEAMAATIASGRLVLAGALVSGLALGFRSQAAWLTLPLLLLVLVDRAGRGAAGALVGSTLWFGVGVLVWAVPLLIASGGPGAYLTALASQGREDWTDADLIVTHLGIRRVAFGLVDTFIRPWGSPVLGGLIVLCVLAGGLVLVARNRRGAAALAAAAVPYAAFHLLFQETPHTRYALPLVPPLAYLAVVGLSALRRVPVAVPAAAAGLVLLVAAGPDLAAYSRNSSPSARALADIAARASADHPQPTPLLRVPQALGLAWRDEDLGLPRIPTLRRRQWSALVDHWRDGSPAPVWYLAEPEASGLDNRHDLALIDPAARRLVRRYRWPFDPVNLLGGVRPSELDWYEMAPPGWMALDGWALTPRLAGLARADGRGPARGGTTVLVRRRAAPLLMLVGGRHLGAPADPAVRFSLQLDGVERDTWTVPAAGAFFLRTIPLAEGASAGEGPFGLVTITSTAADGSGRVVDTAVEQFDVQASDEVMFGFDEGWHEQEYDPDRGRLWHWTSAQSMLWIRHAGGDVALHVRGESPLRYYGRAPMVRVRVDEQILGEFRPASDFDLALVVPASLLDRARGRVTLETDETFVPDERDRNGDRRRLGLRIWQVQVASAEPRLSLLERQAQQ